MSQRAAGPVETDLDDLLRESPDPFLRWSIPVDGLLGAWRLGTTVVVAFDRHPRRAGLWAAVLAAEGYGCETLEAVPDLLGRAPDWLTTDAHCAGEVPPSWGLVPTRGWDYMATARPVPVAGGSRVAEVFDPAEVNAVLDAGNADAFARPGDPAVLGWWGARDDDGLASVGALTRTDRGGGHLRAITTLARARGRGLATGVSAALTNAALADVSAEATLGVYSDNAVAIRMYERLGYRRAHRFVSLRSEP